MATANSGFNDALLIEDIAQEVFINAYTSLYTYGQKSPFKNWLFKITVHICYRKLKIQQKRAESQETDLFPEELSNLDSYIAHSAYSSSFDPEKRAVLRDITDKLLHHLSAKEKMILILSEVEGRTLNEISEMMGLSTINVKISKVDDFVKSPYAALHRIFSHFDVHLSTPRS